MSGRGAQILPWRSVVAFVAGALLGFVGLLAAVWWPALSAARAERPELLPEKLKAQFARPAFVPTPADNPPTPAKIGLGQRLFHDKEVSSTGTVACASCHDPKLAFTDGEPTGRGVSARRLIRHTPTLWNIAWSPLLFWDGRANSLEQQVRFPVEHPDEMGSTLENAVTRFARHESYVSAFAEAFPHDPSITVDNIAKALAAYERTLVSPPTRFDRWIAGDAGALTPSEVSGFNIFAGKGKCSNCHAGFAFTDYGFYDIGLPSADEGRGPIVDLPVAKHAFKTPTLRELAWTAPYMHDGSLATLEDVLRFYEKGGVHRTTRSRDLPSTLKLNDTERGDLIAFLQTLSSESPPTPSAERWVGISQIPKVPPPQDTRVVSQTNKLFAPAHVRLKAGQTMTVLNDDTRTHNVRIYDPRFDYNSGAQEPNDTITIKFPVAGTFEAFCGIHPAMRLTIEVQ